MEIFQNGLRNHNKKENKKKPGLINFSLGFYFLLKILLLNVINL